MNVILSVGLWMCNTVLERTFPSYECIDLSSSCRSVEDRLRDNCGGGSSRPGAGGAGTEVMSFKSWMRESSGSCPSTWVEKSWRGCEPTEENRETTGG